MPPEDSPTPHPTSPLERRVAKLEGAVAHVVTDLDTVKKSIDFKFGQILSASSAAKEESTKGREAAERAADQVVELQSELRANEKARDKMCDVRHGATDRRIDRVEKDTKDTKASMPTLPDYEESPNTGVMSRLDLVRAKRESSEEVVQLREKVAALSEAHRLAEEAKKEAAAQKALADGNAIEAGKQKMGFYTAIGVAALSTLAAVSVALMQLWK